MSFTINIYYTGEKGSAKKFVQEMEENGIAQQIRSEKGNLRYEYFFPLKDDKTVLLIDSWESQEALVAHHSSKMMKNIISLREKYNLHMSVERYVSAEESPFDKKYIRK